MPAGKSSENAIWGYETPYDEMTGLAGHYAFYDTGSTTSRSAEMDALMQNWVVRKPAVASRRGIVASQNGVAAGVGAEILAAGGTRG